MSPASLRVRKLAPILLPTVAFLHPELARPAVLLPPALPSTIVPPLPPSPVLVMSVMMIPVVMVVVVEVPHGPPAPRTSSEATSVEVLIWRRTIPVVGSPSVVGRSSTERWSTVLPGGRWLLVEVSWRTISWEFSSYRPLSALLQL